MKLLDRARLARTAPAPARPDVPGIRRRRNGDLAMTGRLLDVVHYDARYPALRPQSPRAWLDLWDDVLADADARAFANACTLYMRTWLDDMVSAARAQGLASGPEFEEAVAAAPALREAEILGMTGSLGADDLPEAIRVLLRGADALWNGPREMGLDWQRPAGVVTMEVQLRHDYLPALLGEISDDDIAALSALGAP